MEPVTYMMGLIDLIIGYIFWMRTRKSYWYDNVINVAVSKRLNSKYKEVIII